MDSQQEDHDPPPNSPRQQVATNDQFEPDHKELSNDHPPEEQPLAPPRPRTVTKLNIKQLAYLYVYFSVSSLLMLHVAYCVATDTPIVTCLHFVPEGFVAVYWRLGFFLNIVQYPGPHIQMPFIDRHELVRVKPWTKKLTNITCDTKGGVTITFENIEVVSQLHSQFVYRTILNHGLNYDKKWIDDRIRDKFKRFCKSHTVQQVCIDLFEEIDEMMKVTLQSDCNHYIPGLEIMSVHATKPTVPDNMKLKLEKMEEERTKVLIAIERQKVAQKEAETEKEVAISEAQKNATITKILVEQKLFEKDGSRREKQIEDEMYLAHERNMADAYFYRVTKEAEANMIKRNASNFLEPRLTSTLVRDNITIYFGLKVQENMLG